MTSWNPFSWDTSTFVNFLDRRQYNQRSMVERMFERRGAWKNQFGRHAHMGFWSYFEEQYSWGGWTFLPFLLLGLIGLLVAIRKRLELGLPFLTLIVLCTAGLVLYMNFADGVKFTPQNNAYLEVRNRDYFFTPGFVFFGIAMGLGVTGIVSWLKDRLSSEKARQFVVYASVIFLALPGMTLAKNYYYCDRSDNYLPANYAKIMLDTCEKDALLFTAGDNDTFPLWALQEAYNYRRDVRVICLALLNTDWYVEQMKNRYGVPMSLTDEQIVSRPYEVRPGIEGSRPRERFLDRPRGMQVYMEGYYFGEQRVRVQDMIMEDIIIENAWRYPVYFSVQPWDASPLNLRDRAVACGLLFRLDREPDSSLFDIDRTYELFTEVYSYDGMESSEVFRDDNATGLYQAIGARFVGLFDRLLRAGDTARALSLAEMMNEKYAEYWQAHLVQWEHYDKIGDSAKSLALVNQIHDTMTAYVERDPTNLMWLQDLGLVKHALGTRIGDPEMIDEGLEMVWEGFERNATSPFAFRKLVSVFLQSQRQSQLMEAINLFSEYKRNLNDPYLQQLIGISNRGGPAAPPGS
jgi:hypothetical protein